MLLVGECWNGGHTEYRCDEATARHLFRERSDVAKMRAEHVHRWLIYDDAGRVVDQTVFVR